MRLYVLLLIVVYGVCLLWGVVKSGGRAVVCGARGGHMNQKQQKEKSTYITTYRCSQTATHYYLSFVV